jgi:uncharacterized membrane protein YhaH (DUF805 family)
MNWYISVLKKYVVFNGRATRSEYWYFVLFSTIISMILMGIDIAMGSGSAESTVNADTGVAMNMSAGILTGIYSLGVLLPSLAVLIRRLHDTDHSGWWVFISLIPLIGAIILLVFLVKDSTPGDNQYGPNPKNATF